MNYWVVGANWDGVDKTEEFISGGYWEMGWSDVDQPALTKRRDDIARGDRIAIKQLLGQGQEEILIKSLGIVKSPADKEGKVRVNWVVAGLQRRVPIKGCIGTIYGPFTPAGQDNKWINEVFCL